MKLCDINPFIRFACIIKYQSDKRQVNVFDCRIFFVISGRLQITVGEQTFVISEGESFFCPAGSIYTESSPDGCELSMINFDLSHERREITECCPPINYTHGAPVFENSVTVEDCDFLNNAAFFSSNTAVNSKLAAIIREFAEKKSFYREKSSSVMKELIVDIYRGEQRKNDSSFVAVEKVTAHIAANYGSKLCNKALAELVGYHEYHLNRLFLKHKGQTIHSYITDVRLQESKLLLMNTDTPLCQISEQTGFNSASHFSACFKAKFGYGPLEYKRMTKNKI